MPNTDYAVRRANDIYRVPRCDTFIYNPGRDRKLPDSGGGLVRNGRMNSENLVEKSKELRWRVPFDGELKEERGI